MELEKLRKRVDKIDVQVVKLVAARLSLISKIGSYKRKNHLAIVQKSREMEIIRSVKKLARKLGADTRLIESMFSLILRTSKKKQR